VSYETILFEASSHVATITLNRPAAMNSFNRQMMEELEAEILAILDVPRPNEG